MNKLSRSIRNNNPLNIRLGKSRWQGLRKMQEDGAFCQFESMAYGWRAAFILLSTYYNNYGADTIGKIISRWAPQIENDTRGYIRFVSEWTGIDADVPLGSPPEHSARWMAVALAMAMFEGGLSDATPLVASMFQGWETI
jgi:hypothetical protein